MAVQIIISDVESFGQYTGPHFIQSRSEVLRAFGLRSTYKKLLLAETSVHYCQRTEISDIFCTPFVLKILLKLLCVNIN